MRREAAVEQQRPDDLVDGVVAADVLAGQHDVAVGVERGGGVDGAGLAEQALAAEDRLPAPRRARRGAIAGAVRRERHQSCRQGVELIAAAQPAARRRRAQPWRRDRRRPAGLDGDDVELAVDRRAVGAVAHAGDRRPGEQTLGEAEPGGELEVVAGRAHRRGDDLAVELDRQRLLDDDPIRPPRRAPRAVHTRDHHPRNALPDHDQQRYRRSQAVGRRSPR